MIVSHFDEDYIDFAKVYLHSINKFASKEKIYLSVLNFSTGQILDIFDGVKIDEIRNHALKFQGQNKQHLLQNRVTKVIVEALQSNLDSIYIVTNIDMIVRKPLDFLYEKMQDYDIALCLNSTHPRRNPPQILSGFLVFNTTNSKVLDFALEYDELVHKDDHQLHKVKYDGQWISLNDTYHRDQEILYSLYCKYRKCLRFLALDYNKFFAGIQDGVVWSAERTQKQKTLEVFKKEVGYSC